MSLGAARSRRLFSALVLTPFALLPVIGLLARAPAMVLPLLLLPRAWALRRDFVRCASGAAFNAVVFRSFGLELAFAVLLSLAAVVARLLQ